VRIKVSAKRLSRMRKAREKMLVREDVSGKENSEDGEEIHRA
jgi:hypothetical protein